MRKTKTTHGVLVTYHRLDVLADHLKRLASQTLPLTTLTVIDNGADAEVKDLVESTTGQAAATGSVGYLPAAHNPGPAGGFSMGIAEVLSGDVADDDLVVLLDDNDPPWRDDTFEQLDATLDRLKSSGATVGGVGVFGASLSRNGRLRVATSEEPEQVDFLSGAGCPHYTVASLRSVPGPTPSLFFGFEELDLGLALRRAEYPLWSSGLARHHGCRHYVQPTRAKLTVAAPSWRRYYSVRNLITVLRRDGRLFDALFVSIVAGVAKPLVNLPFRPRVAWANLSLTAPAVLDAWLGRMGKRFEPAAES